MPSPGTFPIIHYATTDSTNDIAMEMAMGGGEHGMVVVAGQQTHGRGRGEKFFASPPGGLYMSVILRPELPAARLPLIPLAAGLACACAIEEQTGQAVALKWPNDLYLQGKKLGGILAQTAPYSPTLHTIPFIILGIGINVNSRCETFTPELRTIVTSLYDTQPGNYDIDSLLAAIHAHLLVSLPTLRGDIGPLLSDWQHRDYLLGRQITWLDVRGKTMAGCGAGIRSDGCYQLLAADGTLHAILAGEVTIGPVGKQRK
ncbi:MAG: biotin--[acetyl-CoA-carboxylase] ligase [Desulfobulbaceae bacterium]